MKPGPKPSGRGRPSNKNKLLTQFLSFVKKHLPFSTKAFALLFRPTCYLPSFKKQHVVFKMLVFFLINVCEMHLRVKNFFEFTSQISTRQIFKLSPFVVLDLAR